LGGRGLGSVRSPDKVERGTLYNLRSGEENVDTDEEPESWDRYTKEKLRKGIIQKPGTPTEKGNLLKPRHGEPLIS